MGGKKHVDNNHNENPLRQVFNQIYANIEIFTHSSSLLQRLQNLHNFAQSFNKDFQQSHEGNLKIIDPGQYREFLKPKNDNLESGNKNNTPVQQQSLRGSPRQVSPRQVSQEQRSYQQQIEHYYQNQVFTNTFWSNTNILKPTILQPGQNIPSSPFNQIEIQYIKDNTQESERETIKYNDQIDEAINDYSYLAHCHIPNNNPIAQQQLLLEIYQSELENYYQNQVFPNNVWQSIIITSRRILPPGQVILPFQEPIELQQNNLPDDDLGSEEDIYFNNQIKQYTNDYSYLLRQDNTQQNQSICSQKDS